MQSDSDRLVDMLNAIAVNAGASPDPELARAAVLAHLQRFWARSLKRSIITCLHTHAQAMHPVAFAAVQQLAQEWQDLEADVK